MVLIVTGAAAVGTVVGWLMRTFQTRGNGNGAMHANVGELKGILVGVTGSQDRLADVLSDQRDVLREQTSVLTRLMISLDAFDKRTHEYQNAGQATMAKVDDIHEVVVQQRRGKR